MGCQQSKSTAVIAFDENGNTINKKMNNHNKNKNQPDKNSITNIPTTTRDEEEDVIPTPNNNHNNHHHHPPILRMNEQSPTPTTQTVLLPQPTSSTVPNSSNTSTAAAVTTTTTIPIRNSTTRSSDRVYKLLLKASQNRSNTNTRGNTSSNNNNKVGNLMNTNSGNYKHKKNVVPIENQPTLSLDDKAVLQAMSPSAASYRNPETHVSPLHLAVQLIDSHSLATVTTSTLATSSNNNKKNQQQQRPPLSSSSSSTSESALLQVISELIRAYPEAVFTPDIYGYIPLHYAIAPTTTTTTTGNMTSKLSSSSSLQQEQSTPSKTKTTMTTKSKTQSPMKSQQDSHHQQQQQQEPLPASLWPLRTAIVRLLLHSDTTTASYDYLLRNDVTYNSSNHSNTNNYYNHHHHNFDTMIKCSPLYRIVQMIPDDSTIQHAPTLEYIHVVLKFMVQKRNQQHQQVNHHNNKNNRNHDIMYGTPIVSMGNAYDGDKPLSLLYRRFTRQFDVSEQFFTGDNSRTEVVEHRMKYKTAASNTWKIIELLIQQQEQQQFPLTKTVPSGENTKTNNNNTKNNSTMMIKTTYRIVHRAVQGETPPDLLRYIVETNADDLTISDEVGNLPLHYAARYRPKQQQQQFQPMMTAASANCDKKSSFPAFYSKYVMDELLYKYPEAASIPDRDGFYPLQLAVQSGKQWIGGGIKSLYDAYPDAVIPIDLMKYPAFQRVLASSNSHDLLFTSSTTIDDITTTAEDELDYDDHRDEKKVNTPQQQQLLDIVRDEQHDAIMLVQDENVDISEVVTSMWAHEEDAGVQMLGCIAIRRILDTTGSENNTTGNNNKTNDTKEHCLRIALSAVPAVVNAMKAHPNEVVVQEKACHTLRAMASADGQREVSFVASGAVAAIVGAMQAHVSDPTVQEEACGALSQILLFGGPDRATVIASVSGLTAILNAIAAHPGVGPVQKEGCQALYELTNYTDTANLPELPKSQTEPLLEQAKSMYPQDCTEMVDLLLLRLT